MNRTSLTRRLFTGAVGLFVGSAAALALAAPAAATQDGPETMTYTSNKVEVTGSAECDAEARTWTVNWTVTNNFHLVEQATVNAVSSPVDGFEVGTVVPAGESVSGTQQIPSGTESAELTVELRWTWEWPPYSGHWFEKKRDATAVVELADCGEPEPEPEEPQSGEVLFEFDCEVFTLTITNTTDVEEVLTVVPSEGEPVEVTVPAGTEEAPGESEPVSFPSSEGLVVDVQFEGESVIDGGPIEITSEEWAELGCDEGEGGELPTTGSSTMLIAGGAVALLALGGGLFLVARRRRVTFTA